MATGSGLSSSVGFATESSYGVPVAVNRFFEFDSESVQSKKTPIFGTGLRGGAYTASASRRSAGTRTVDGDINMDVPSNGFGILLYHMFGTPTVTPTSVGGGLYQQVHTLGTLNGRSFTTQIVRAATDGDLTTAAYTYPGCKITEWELSVAQGAQLKLKMTISARDEATPSNSFANTTLSAAVTVGATSISTVGSVPANSYISLDTGAAVAEVVKTTTVTGSGPYTVTLASGFLPTQAHASGAVVSSATATNYGAVTAFQTPTYSSTRTLFTFVQGSLVAGGTTTQTGGVWSNSGGTVVGNVHSFTLTGTTPMKTDRFGLGTQLVSEPIENGWRTYTGEAEIELNSRMFYDAYMAEQQLDMQLTFVTPQGATLKLVVPAAFQDDGVNPVVGGPDVITTKPKFSFLDDGTNGVIQAIYTSTDAAL
jgi:hypothetical protein